MSTCLLAANLSTAVWKYEINEKLIIKDGGAVAPMQRDVE